MSPALINRSNKPNEGACIVAFGLEISIMSNFVSTGCGLFFKISKCFNMFKIPCSAIFVMLGSMPPPPPSSAAIIGTLDRSAAEFKDLLSLFCPKIQIVGTPKIFASFRFF